MRNYDSTDISSIFDFSEGLIHKSLFEAVQNLDSSITKDQLVRKGKGGLGQLVEKYFFGYEPNSDPNPDFPEAGVELKVTPLKKSAKNKLVIKERLVCDMINFCEIVNVSFEDSPFYKKSQLMLILFYLHITGEEIQDLEFLFSVLWRLKDKDLLIIKQDYQVIVDKIREGKAHELSEGDTMYLAACRKGQKGDSLREQPYNDVGAPRRAFSLKPAYMRTILNFVESSGKNRVTNTKIKTKDLGLVSLKALKNNSFEDIITNKFKKFIGKDYKQIATHFKMTVGSQEKSKYARITKRILSKNITHYDDAEEIRKAGIITKTIRVEANGRIKENMSFENIDYKEVYETKEWINSRWYEIVTSRFMFVVFREVPTNASKWKDEKHYVFDKVIFWTMPVQDMGIASEYWANIQSNVKCNTLQDSNNTYWKLKDHRAFHVRPKAQNSADKHYSPVDGLEVPKKAYWFNNKYVERILQREYGEEKWNELFEAKKIK